MGDAEHSEDGGLWSGAHEQRGPDGEHPPAVSLRWLNKRLIIVMVLSSAFTAMIVGGATALFVQRQANMALRANAILGCDGSNLLRGFARLATHHFEVVPPDDHDLSDWLLRVRDCAASYDDGRVVVLAPRYEVAYLERILHFHRVAARDGGRRFVPIP